MGTGESHAGGDLPAWQGCLALLGLGLAGWLTYAHFPISLYCVGSGLAALALYAVKSDDPSQARFQSLKQRFVEILAKDSKRILLFLCIGFGLVWLAQIVLNLLRSEIDPAQIFALEYRLYEAAAWLNLRVSAATLLTGLAVALLLMLLLSTAWPIRVLGALRQTVSAALTILATLTAFTFVTVEQGTPRHELFAGPIRARIVDNLTRLAAARQEHAAWQWMTAELRRDALPTQGPAPGWREYFQHAARVCEQEDRRFQARYLTLLAREPAQASRTGTPSRTAPDYCNRAEFVTGLAQARVQPIDVNASPPGRPWLPDFPLEHGPPDGPNGGTAVDRQIVRFSELDGLVQRSERAAAEAERATSIARGVAIDALATLLPPEFDGIAEVIADAWKGSFLEAVAGEAASRIRARVDALRVPMEGHVGPALAALLLASQSPVEAPATAARRQGSIERVVSEDLRGLDRPSPEAAAERQVASERPPVSRPPTILLPGPLRPPRPIVEGPPPYRPPPFRIEPYRPPWRPPSPFRR